MCVMHGSVLQYAGQLGGCGVQYTAPCGAENQMRRVLLAFPLWSARREAVRVFFRADHFELVLYVFEDTYQPVLTFTPRSAFALPRSSAFPMHCWPFCACRSSAARASALRWRPRGYLASFRRLRPHGRRALRQSRTITKVRRRQNLKPLRILISYYCTQDGCTSRIPSGLPIPALSLPRAPPSKWLSGSTTPTPSTSASSRFSAARSRGRSQSGLCSMCTGACAGCSRRLLASRR